MDYRSNPRWVCQWPRMPRRSKQSPDRSPQQHKVSTLPCFTVQHNDNNPIEIQRAEKKRTDISIQLQTLAQMIKTSFCQIMLNAHWLWATFANPRDKKCHCQAHLKCEHDDKEAKLFPQKIFLRALANVLMEEPPTWRTRKLVTHPSEHFVILALSRVFSSRTIRSHSYIKSYLPLTLRLHKKRPRKNNAYAEKYLSLCRSLTRICIQKTHKSSQFSFSLLAFFCKRISAINRFPLTCN